MVAIWRNLARCAALAGVGAVLTGSGTITDGNASMTLIGTPVFNTATGDATLITDTGAVDQAYKYTWYYRTPTNNQNTIMSKWNAPSEQYTGDTCLITWLNAGPTGAERFDAQLSVRIDDLAVPGHTNLAVSMTVRNASTQTLTFQFFNMIDLDLGGTPLDDTAVGTDFSEPNGVRLLFSEASGKTAECFGLAATRWEVGPGSTLRAKLSSGSQNLSNVADPYTGDAAVAFQWTLTLAPGEIRTVYGGLAAQGLVPCPADFDANGFVNGEDVDEFLLHFTLGSPEADFDRNGFTNGDDFDPFMERYISGC